MELKFSVHIVILILNILSLNRYWWREVAGIKQPSCLSQIEGASLKNSENEQISIQEWLGCSHFSEEENLNGQNTEFLFYLILTFTKGLNSSSFKNVPIDLFSMLIHVQVFFFMTEYLFMIMFILLSLKLIKCNAKFFLCVTHSNQNIQRCF